MKKAVSFIFSISLLVFGIVSCTCEDINGGWSLEKPVSQIQGVVLMAEQSLPVANASIEVEVGGKIFSAKTDEKGYYTIYNIDTGSGIASVSVADPSIHGGSKHVTIVENTIAICNFILTKSSSEVTFEKVGDDDLYTIALPDVIQKDKETIQIATYYITNGTLQEEEKLELEAWFELKPNIYPTKAGIIDRVDKEGFVYLDDNIDIIVAATTTLGSEQSLKPYSIEVKDLMPPVCVLQNGVEVEAKRDDEKNVSYFETSEIGETVLTYPIYAKTINDGYEEITFSNAEYVSDGGTTDIKTNYYSKGIDYEWDSSTPSILWQYAVLMTGGNQEGITCDYSASVNIPKGEAIVLEGKQHYTVKRFKCGWAYVDAKIYDQVFIEYKDRKHTGGSN